MSARRIPAVAGLTAMALTAALGSPASAQGDGAAPGALAQPIASVATAADDAEPLATVSDLMSRSGLQGTVLTEGYRSAGDGGAMAYSIQPTRPAGALGGVSVPTADGAWAVPTGFAVAPTAGPDTTAVEDEIARATTFADAGSALVRDARRSSPLTTDEAVRASQSSPYPITAPSFVGMVLMGWDYSHTTYVADSNTRVGSWVDFGAAPGADLWQAHGLARWFHSHGDLWLSNGEDYQRGDILFFSKQDPEGPGTTGSCFANVYHTAIYLGDGKVAHSRDGGAGVVIEPLPEDLKQDLSLAARPVWQSAPQSADGARNPGPGAEGPSAPTTAAPDASASPTATSAEGSATPTGSAPRSSGVAVLADDEPRQGASAPTDNVVVVAEPVRRHRRTGPLASTGTAVPLALAAALFLCTGGLLLARKRVDDGDL